MPKKRVVENSKAVAARLRKIAAQEAEDARKQKEEEDAYWKEDDKLILRKQQRKQEREEKRMQVQQKKHDNKTLFENEMSIAAKNSKKPPLKLTRAQIQSNTKQTTQHRVVSTDSLTITENLNKLNCEEEEARSVAEAIALLEEKPDKIVKNPEKKLKAAYVAFEETRLQQLKAENASLRHSQLKEIVFKEWQKSALNPMNAAQ